jgi:membrane associated rhomboid family serine protease
MLLPYRAKNPPEHFPFVTIALIVINVVVFLVTSERFLVIRDEVVEQWAVSHETLNPLRMLTAMFLHNDIFHLAGNMLFLWIFGAAAEGRMRPPLFIVGYLIAGFAGDLLHEAIMGVLHPSQFSLGASGAIMGVAGMYLYMFPFSAICAVHRQYWIMGWLTVSDLQARWVILTYIGLDLLHQVILQGADGVGHLAHLGGFAAGFLIVLAFRMRKDTEDISEAQATRAEMKDFSLLSYRDLEALMAHPTDDMRLVMAYCEKALTSTSGMRAEPCLAAVRQYIRPLMERADPVRLGWVLLTIPAGNGGVPPMYYLRVASRLEAMASNDYAARLYRRVYDLFPTAPDTETALFRLAKMTETIYQNRQQAYAIYHEMLRLFPNGQMALEVRRTLQTSYQAV